MVRPQKAGLSVQTVLLANGPRPSRVILDGPLDRLDCQSDWPDF